LVQATLFLLALTVHLLSKIPSKQGNILEEHEEKP